MEIKCQKKVKKKEGVFDKARYNFMAVLLRLLKEINTKINGKINKVSTSSTMARIHRILLQKHYVATSLPSTNKWSAFVWLVLQYVSPFLGYLMQSYSFNRLIV